MARLNSEQLHEFLSRNNIPAKIATLKDDGAPYVNAVWYEYDGKDIYIVGRAKSQFVKNIRKDPRIAVLIDDPKPPYTRVLIEATAEIINREWVDIALRMARRYLGENGPELLKPTLGWARALIRVNLSKVTSWDRPDWHQRYYIDEPAH